VRPDETKDKSVRLYLKNTIKQTKKQKLDSHLPGATDSCLHIISLNLLAQTNREATSTSPDTDCLQLQKKPLFMFSCPSYTQHGKFRVNDVWVFPQIFTVKMLLAQGF
jgi:hypothetical protein